MNEITVTLPEERWVTLKEMAADSGVIAAFRQCCVKHGLTEADYGDIYGRMMDDRHISDCDAATDIESDRAQTDLDDARRFVDRIERFLEEGGWL